MYYQLLQSFQTVDKEREFKIKPSSVTYYSIVLSINIVP